MKRLRVLLFLAMIIVLLSVGTMSIGGYDKRNYQSYSTVDDDPYPVPIPRPAPTNIPGDPYDPAYKLFLPIILEDDN